MMVQAMDADEHLLRRTNLNMLVTLREIIKHRNLTRAAESLNLTQSAVSNSLRQLRKHFGDELLVRNGRTMRLTERALKLVEPLEAALLAVQLVLKDVPFSPSTSTKRFRIATVDYVAAISAPVMANILADEAPRVSVQIITAKGRPDEDLRLDNIDLVIAPRQILAAASYDTPISGFRFRTLDERAVRVRWQGGRSRLQ